MSQNKTCGDFSRYHTCMSWLIGTHCFCCHAGNHDSRQADVCIVIFIIFMWVSIILTIFEITVSRSQCHIPTGKTAFLIIIIRAVLRVHGARGSRTRTTKKAIDQHTAPGGDAFFFEFWSLANKDSVQIATWFVIIFRAFWKELLFCFTAVPLGDLPRRSSQLVLKTASQDSIAIVLCSSGKKGFAWTASQNIFLWAIAPVSKFFFLPFMTILRIKSGNLQPRPQQSLPKPCGQGS